MIIINADDNIINISPLLSVYYSFYQRIINKEEKFYYFFNKTKYALITFIIKSKIKIFENDSIIYENETQNFFKIFEFKENTNYTIIYNQIVVSKGFPTINFHFYSQPIFFKHDFKNEPAIIHSNKNFIYYFDIDISGYNLGENIIFFLTGDISQSEHSIGYQFKNDLKEKNYINFKTIHNYISIKKN